MDSAPIGGELVLERLATRPQLDALMETVTALCLSEPLPPVEETARTNNDQRLIAQLGTQSLRDALTMVRLGEHSDHQTPFSPADVMALRRGGPSPADLLIWRGFFFGVRTIL